MGKNRPTHEATAQAALDGHRIDVRQQTDRDQPYEGFHLGDESGRRAGQGDAGMGSNRSERD